MERISQTARIPLAAILGSLIGVVFFPVLHFGFLNWDDIDNFIRNPWLRGFSHENLLWPGTARLLDVYQPVSWIFLQAQYALAPENPAACIHAVSLLLHLANTILLFTLFTKLSKAEDRPSRIAALGGAIYFGLHPLQCETVAWASAQPYLLAGFWAGLSLLCFLRSLESSRSRWYWLSVTFFALSLFSKIILIGLPVIFAILRFTREPPKKTMLRTLCLDSFFWVFSALALAVSLWAVVNPPEKSVSLTEAGKLALGYLGFFIVKVIHPSGLSPLYDPALLSGLDVALGLLFLAATIFCVVKTKYRNLGLFFLALIILLAPGLARALTVESLFSDRYAYFPNAVIGLGFGHVVYRTLKTEIPLWLFAIFFGVGLGVLSRAEVSHWKDPMTLWGNAVQNGGASSYKAHNILGSLLADKGKFDDAIAHYRRALELKPNASEAHNNLAIALAHRGEMDRAIEQYREALRIRPDFSQAHNNLAVALTHVGKREEAIQHYRKAVELNPDFIEALNGLGNLLTAQGQLEEVNPLFQRLLKIRPDSADFHNSFGVALAREGRLDEAIGHFRKAVELDPGQTNARHNLELALSEQNKSR